MREFIYLRMLSIAYKRAIYWGKKCNKASENVTKWVAVHHKYYDKIVNVNLDGKGGIE